MNVTIDMSKEKGSKVGKHNECLEKLDIQVI